MVESYSEKEDLAMERSPNIQAQPVSKTIKMARKVSARILIIGESCCFFSSNSSGNKTFSNVTPC
jgi:hypothetical protein